MKKKYVVWSCLALCVLGIGLAIHTHSRAVGDYTTNSGKALFALGVIFAAAGLAGCLAGVGPRQQKTDVHNLALTSIFAALCYVGCTYLRIPIPGYSTFFHFGNTFCVLGALFLGGFWGGMAGSVGMTLSDLLNGHVDSAPRTFILKLCIGLITGLVAHSLLHISDPSNRRKRPLVVDTALSCAAGMAFNVVADPLLGYFYKMYVLGQPQIFAETMAKMASIVTAVNAVVAVFSATVFYLALRPALTRAKLMPRIQ